MCSGRCPQGRFDLTFERPDAGSQAVLGPFSPTSLACRSRFRTAAQEVYHFQFERSESQQVGLRLSKSRAALSVRSLDPDGLVASKPLEKGELRAPAW